ncbi:MAG: plasmid mobilization relaxosome protein MobC [Clostridiales bacterium]|nr:plasmid mobilization relaxosome protein MobC [Clostridiales bacterium]
MNRKRNHQFSLRLSDSEQALWDKKQTASGLNKTEFFIRTLKNSVVKIYHFDESIKELIKELRKVGVNLNQAAHLLNSGFLFEANQEIRNMNGEYSEVMEKIKNFLEKPLINATIIDKTDGDDNAVR